MNCKITSQEDFTKAAALPPCSLEAGMSIAVGHPIAGTSPGATYFLVAQLDGLGVAMRWKGAHLSVRVSGPKLADYSARLLATGIFANHTSYFSAHLGQQGVTDDGVAAQVSAQMLYASVLAAVAGDVDGFIERAPYGWRDWIAPAASTPVN